jgi:hypothetical protein
MTKNNLAVRDAFLKPAKLREATFECGPIGSVRMLELSGSQYSREFTDWLQPKGKRNPKREAVMWTKLVTLCVVDADGNRLLTEDDIEAIETQPKSVLSKLQSEALKVHGLAEEASDDDPLEPSDD